MIKKAFPLATIIYNDLSLSIVCHVGPNAVGVGFAKRHNIYN